MKVGTDGVLLGAWSNIDESVNSILDIGSGTGLIALMMAQRSFAEVIDAVEKGYKLGDKIIRYPKVVIGQ